MHHAYTYLALGDSYTIGEGLELQRSFPYQTVGLLRKAGFTFYAPEIIAKTGWTTDELEAAMNDYSFLPKYDFVSLLIGVNNQYRGRDIIEYKEQFEHLLKRGIALAGGKPEHVLVLSIPDYSVTPFGQRMDAEKIAKEIDAYNTLNKALSIQFKVQYVDVTDISRKAKDKATAVVADGLHPSEKTYSKWAKEMVALMKATVKK
ncbi:SGNH/GDSL hydrolase family protein [Flavisolibacter ginsenosidimutans]|uniref:SGNH/GDSL hydrolase family protein n=1 Tax=Flavisolibacter ginsenosidimutans TaxID=661481 RepID=A0A5B8UF64_9BACT|nr:SGNH/GDSL hydrolase family protein [Flavisolibacter ginsenosidimutans]QEC54946.1 SGNH/GDSL hydrolase family protein [Flavisolibacter ginsenosidimutans]